MKLLKYFKENPKGDEDDIIIVIAEDVDQATQLIERDRIQTEYYEGIQDNYGDFVMNYYPDFYNGRIRKESNWEVVIELCDSEISPRIVYMSGEFGI